MERVDMEKIAADVVPDFPTYNEKDLSQLILGSSQFCMAQYYIQEHFDTNQGLDILVCDGISGLMSAKIQSRHVSAKQPKCWIRYST